MYSTFENDWPKVTRWSILYNLVILEWYISDQLVISEQPVTKLKKFICQNLFNRIGRNDHF